MQQQQVMLLLPEAPPSLLSDRDHVHIHEEEDEDDDDLIKSFCMVKNPLSGYPYYRHVERVGMAYEELLYRQHQHQMHMQQRARDGLSSHHDIDADMEDQMDDDDAEKGSGLGSEGGAAAAAGAAAQKKRHMHGLHALARDDYYELLGLGQLRWEATTEQIRKAYRLKAMEHHPDKTQDKDDTMFKAVNKAWETLNDEKKRRTYDSIDDLDLDDVELPDAATFDTARFFEAFGSLFQRWSKWSEYKPVPKLGDENTPYRQVEQLYKFWTNFKSWRDFSFEDEYDVNEAEVREERRWMERQNDKKRRKKKEEERKKIREMVALAQRLDPRVRKHEETSRLNKLAEQKKRDEKMAKARREKEEREAAEKRREEEEVRKAEEEKKRKKEEEVQRARETEEVKDKLRAIARPHLLLENKQSSSDNNSKQQQSILINDMDFVMLRLKLDQMREFVSRLENLQSTPDKMVLCFNQTVKKIREGDAKKQQENSKQGSGGADGQQHVNKGPWTMKELSLLTKAVALFPGGAAARWDRIAEHVGTRSADEVKQKTAEIKTMNVLKGQVPKSNAFDEFEKFKKTHETAKKKSEDPTQPAAVNPVEDWNNDQQKLLENGIRTHKAVKDANEKWELIAQMVPGKSAKDCRERYNHCKQLALQKRKAATG